MTDLGKQMDQMVDQQEQMKSFMLTPDVVGRATIGTFGREMVYVEINEDGKASMYLSAEKISFTYRDSDDISHTVELSVRGSFVNRDDPGHLIMLSAKAGRDLGMNGITRQIVVGPVK